MSPQAARHQGEVTTTVVLLVDDNVPLRTLFAKLLRQTGYAVLEACDGVGALAHLEACAGGRCVLVTDWEMPTMGGAELVRVVRSDARFARIPIVVATGALGVKTAREIPVLQKPYTVRELLERIEVAIDHARTFG